MDRRSREERGHANVTWWCEACGRRNRISVRCNTDPVTVACEHCDRGEADIIPATVVTYTSRLGPWMEDEQRAG